MANKNFSGKLHDAVDNYYQHNPDTLMPLMMLSVALKGNLKISVRQDIPANAACSLPLEEMQKYEWVILDTNLKNRIDQWLQQGAKYVNVEMEIGRSLYQIYQTFRKNDEIDVVREHHHRIGRLVHHSSNEASEKAHRQYATFLLAEVILNTPKEFLKKQYLRIFNHILVTSGLQPKRPRIRVAEALCTLLKYDGKGLLYNPFAGCCIAGAMIHSANNFYGDGDPNDKLYAAALLLNYGMGISNEHFLQNDSTLWLQDKKIDYIISTYTGYIDGQTTFDFCLGKCLNDSSFSGRYAGMVTPKDVFENETPNFCEALKRDWIETIALLPFGEVAILVNARKSETQKGKISFINGTSPLATGASINELLNNPHFSDELYTNDVMEPGYLRSLIGPYMSDQAGYEKIVLGNYLSKIPRKVYDLNVFDDQDKVYAYIDRKTTYQGNRWNENIKRKRIENLFSPAYNLSEQCLIVNSSGLPEPRLFDPDFVSVFFDDGFAFTINPDADINIFWLVEELNKPYVRRQLHPYGLNEMVPEPLTEDDYLNLVLYKEVEDDADTDKEEITDALPVNYIIKDGNIQYTFLKFLGHGFFGYTYKAEMLNCSDGTREIVAIKEFYPHTLCHRENNKVILDDPNESLDEFRQLFRCEPEVVMSLGTNPENHVAEIKSIFESSETGTLYFAMKFYEGESITEMIQADQVPSSESLIIEKIVLPLCKAIHALHSHHILHLDIKPDNIVIDENGEAVLIDFGVAQKYDEEGRLLGRGHVNPPGPYIAPENNQGGMRYFCPQADIFGIAATLYTMVSGGNYPTIIEGYYDKMAAMDMMECSEQMKDAVTEGMYRFSNDRPANAQLFLNLFPGCEDIKLK